MDVLVNITDVSPTYDVNVEQIHRDEYTCISRRRQKSDKKQPGIPVALDVKAELNKSEHTDEETV